MEFPLNTLSTYCFIITLLNCWQDGHEICFVGDEAFRELSKVDPNAEHLLSEVSGTTLSLFYNFI